MKRIFLICVIAISSSFADSIVIDDDQKADPVTKKALFALHREKKLLAEESISKIVSFMSNFKIKDFCDKGDQISLYHIYHSQSVGKVSGSFYYNESKERVYIIAFHR